MVLFATVTLFSLIAVTFSGVRGLSGNCLLCPPVSNNSVCHYGNNCVSHSSKVSFVQGNYCCSK